MSLTPHTHYSRRYAPSDAGSWCINELMHQQSFVSSDSPSKWRERITLNACTVAPDWLVATLPEWAVPTTGLDGTHILGTLLWGIASQGCSVWARGTPEEQARLHAEASKSLITLARITEFLGVDTDPEEEHLRARAIIETCIYSNMVSIDGLDGKPVLPGVAINLAVGFERGTFHYDPDFYGSSWDGESLGAVMAKSIENEGLGETPLSAILPALNSGGFTVIGVVAASAWASGIEELANRTFRLSSTHSV